MARLCVLPVLLLIIGSGARGQAPDVGLAELSIPPLHKHGSNSPSAAEAVNASDKWFITVLVRSDCQFCDRMVAAFAEHPDLRVFVNTEDHRKSWANWNVCSMDDPKLAARFKPPYSDLKIKGYPTLLVQPPLNGKYGSAQAIVLQKTGYDGNATKLAQQVITAVERYAETVEQARHPEVIANRRSPAARSR